MREKSTPHLCIRKCVLCCQHKHESDVEKVEGETMVVFRCRDEAGCREREEESMRRFDAAWEGLLRVTGGEGGGA